MSWIRVSSTAFQPLEAYSNAKSSAHAFRSHGRQIVFIDFQKEGDKDHFLWEAVSQTSQPVSLAVTSSEREASILDKFHDHLDHLLMR